MEIITNRYRRETGLSAYKHNWFGKRIHNQAYIDWLEKQCTINSVVFNEAENCPKCLKPKRTEPNILQPLCECVDSEVELVCNRDHKWGGINCINCGTLPGHKCKKQTN